MVAAQCERRGHRTFTGTYHEVEPVRRLVCSCHFRDTGSFPVIAVDLTPDRDGTRLEFPQTGVPDARARIEPARGWPHALRVMSDALLAKHGVGTPWPRLPGKTHLDGDARDLEAARERLFREPVE